MARDKETKDTKKTKDGGGDTMWRMRATSTSETNRKSSVFSALFRGRKATEGGNYSYDDFDQAVEKKDKDVATKAAEVLILQSRADGNWWMVDDILTKLIKAFPDTVLRPDVSVAMVAYGISREKFDIAEQALKWLERKEPRHELFERRLPAFIELCLKTNNVKKASNWFGRYRNIGQDRRIICDLNRKIAAISPELAVPEEVLKGDLEMRLGKEPEGENGGGTSVEEKPNIREVLENFTFAELIRNNYLDEAFIIFMQSENASIPDCHPYDLIRLTEGLVRAKQFKQALKVVSRLPQIYPDSPEAPQALYIGAWLLMDVFKMADRAREMLTIIINRYPRSVYELKARNYLEKVKKALEQ